MKGLANHARDLHLVDAYAFGLAVPSEDEIRSYVPDPEAHIQLRYARHKPGHSLCLSYELEDANGGLSSWTLKLRPGQAPRHWLFPADPILRGAPRALDLKRRARELQTVPRFEPFDLRWKRSSIELLRYKPERRAVLRLDLAHRDAQGVLDRSTLALRVLAPKDGERTLRARQALECSHVPALVAAHAQHGHLFEEWIAGQAQPQDHATAIAALARLHASPSSAAMPDAQALPTYAELAALLAPFGALGALAQRLSSLSIAGPQGVVHGDFHADQWLLSDAGPCLLDLDNLGVGPFARDLASYAADPFGGDAYARLHQIRQLYLAAGGADIDPRILEQALAQELLRRAAARLRRLELNAVEHAERDLLEARALIAGSIVRVECQLEHRTDTLRQANQLAWERFDGKSWSALHLAEDSRLPGAERLARSIEQGSLELLSWRPGRRAVAQAAVHVVKILKKGRAQALVDKHLALQKHSPWRTARILRFDPELEWLEWERLPGRTLDWFLDQSLATVLAEQLRLGQATPTQERAHRAPDELVELNRVRTNFQRWWTREPLGWTNLLLRLEQRMPVDERMALAHRDLYPAQLLVHESQLQWLDLDLAGPSAPERDPANFLAHADLDWLRGRLDTPTRALWEQALLPVAAAQPTFRWYRAASLARLAWIWRGREGGALLAPRLVELGERILDG